MLIRKIQTRWQAFAVHLLICLLIFILVAALILLDWYPGYFRYFGGLLGIALIAGIDLVLGPALTLIIFDRKKKHLKWDLAVIVLIQASALGYGIWSVYQGRPLAQVLTQQGVYMLTQSDFTTYDVTADELSKIGPSLPIKVYLDLPHDREQIRQIAEISQFVEQKPLQVRVDLYRVFSAAGGGEVKGLLATGGFDAGSECAQLPIYGRNAQFNYGCLVFNTGELINLK